MNRFCFPFLLTQHLPIGSDLLVAEKLSQALQDMETCGLRALATPRCFAGSAPPFSDATSSRGPAQRDETAMIMLT